MAKLKPSKWLNVRSILSLFLCSTIGASLIGAPLVVYADDDEFYQLEPYQIFAIKFFLDNGYNSNIVTYTDSDYNTISLTTSTVSGRPDYITGISGSSSTTQYNHLRVILPLLNGNFVHRTSYNNAQWIKLEYGKHYYISLITTSDVTLVGYSYRGGTINVSQIQKIGARGLVKYVWDVSSTWTETNEDTDWATLDFQNISTSVYPIYMGTGEDINDALRQEMGIQTTTEALLTQLVAGSDEAIDSITDNSQVQSEFDDKNTQYHTYESQINSNMEDAEENIDLTNNLYSNSKFLGSANWVRVQFERLVINTPFELIIVFSLILGIALIFAGKVR